MSLCILRLEKGLDHSRFGRLSHADDNNGDEEKPLKSNKVDKKIKTNDVEKGESLLAAYDSVTSQSKC